MGDISNEVKKHSEKFDASEFAILCGNLASMNLEEAIDKSSLSESSLEALRRVVWTFINDRDLSFFRRLMQNRSSFPLAELLKIVISATPNTASVITTNYDRLAEYAADLIKANSNTGFEGNLIRAMEFPTTALQNRRIKARERVVNIWKVHGSLDWFADRTNEIVSFPLAAEIPPDHVPLIIAPGKGKYSVTHSEPYREVITQADIAFIKAGAYLCIGYGFNDDHIQPKLIEQIRNGKPIVALCHTATEACKHNVMSADVRKYVVVECAPGAKTSVTGNDYREIYCGDFWQLSSFIQTIWR